MIRILVADAQYLFREGFKHILSERKDMKVIGEVTEPVTLMKALLHDCPDILVIDYNVPGAFTVGDLKAVADLEAPPKVLVISTDRQKTNILRVLELNVNSYLTKECDQQEIIDAIYATAKGEKFFCNKVLDMLLADRENSNPEDCTPTKLSKRETEVVKLLTKGMNTRQIAETLFLSEHTVYTHRKNITRKLRIKSLSELTLYAVKAGIVQA